MGYGGTKGWVMEAPGVDYGGTGGWVMQAPGDGWAVAPVPPSPWAGSLSWLPAAFASGKGKKENSEVISNTGGADGKRTRGNKEVEM